MRPPFNTRNIFASLAILLACMVGIFAWKSRETKESSAPLGESPVQTMVMETADFRSTASFSGLVRGIHQADISPKLSGYVISLLKEPGDLVQAGDILAIIDGNEVASEAQGASSALSAAIHSLEQTERYGRQQVSSAETALSKTKSDRRNGNATDKDVRVAEEAVKTAKRLRDVEIAAAESVVSKEQGAKNSTGAYSDNRFVRAPFSGTIASKQSSIGSFVSPGSALYTIVSPNDIEISVSVPIRIASSVQKGTPLLLFPEHSEEGLSGYVFSVAPMGDPSTGETIATVRINGDSDTPTILPGQYASVEFPSGREESALSVPSSAIIRQYDETFVFTVVDSKARKQLISLGRQSGDLREVRSGLNPGDIVITQGGHALREGTLVREVSNE